MHHRCVGTSERDALEYTRLVAAMRDPREADQSRQELLRFVRKLRTSRSLVQARR